MIQLNLLPDIKAEYVKAQRTKRTVIVASFILSAASVGVVVMLSITAFGVQQLALNNVESEIDTNVNTINESKDLDKILTVQNQLISIDALHVAKPVTSRVFNYLQKTTPSDVKMDTYTVDYATNTMTISGNAPSLESINKYVDTLKFTVIEPEQPLEQGTEPAMAFSNVVLSSFSANAEESTYSLTLTFDPELFNSQNPNIDIIVPKITTTRSQIEAPGALFKQNTESNQNEGAQ